jgi:hypothetical protein
LPTTTLLLVLPPEHAFNADAYKIVLDVEVANLDHLNTNLKNIQDCFVLQDGRCQPYEEMAELFIQNEGSAAAGNEERPDDEDVVAPEEPVKDAPRSTILEDFFV